jgi:ATP-dependent Lon protease
MNSILKQIIPSWWLVASLVFPAAVSAQSLTPSQIQQINSGLFRSNSQDFFEQGNRQLEREIAALLRKTATSEGKILEIDEKLISQLCREDFQIPSRHSDTISAADVSSFNAQLKEICRKN